MSLKSGSVPCRLSVILAREAPVGVIFRRGPSRLVELIKWCTDTDTFERGQWFKGRIEEHYSDLSPDGSHLIYLAGKTPVSHSFNPDRFTCWTAISRPPWLTAVAFWPGRGWAYLGGGLFLDNQTVSISCDGIQHDSPKVRKPDELVVVTQSCLAVCSARLERSGWRRKPIVRPLASDAADLCDAGAEVVFEREDRSGLRTIVRGWNHAPGSVLDGYAVVDRQSGRTFPLDGAFWADWDQQGRLVFTRHGKVFAGEFDDQGQVVPRELADFNADTFEPREAPVRAREW